MPRWHPDGGRHSSRARAPARGTATNPQITERRPAPPASAPQQQWAQQAQLTRSSQRERPGIRKFEPTVETTSRRHKTGTSESHGGRPRQTRRQHSKRECDAPVTARADASPFGGVARCESRHQLSAPAPERSSSCTRLREQLRYGDGSKPPVSRHPRALERSVTGCVRMPQRVRHPLGMPLHLEHEPPARRRRAAQ